MLFSPIEWVSRGMPDRGKLRLFWGSVAITAVVAIAVILTSRSADWQPFSLFLVLMVFNLVAELLAVRPHWRFWSQRGRPKGLFSTSSSAGS